MHPGHGLRGGALGHISAPPASAPGWQTGAQAPPPLAGGRGWPTFGGGASPSYVRVSPPGKASLGALPGPGAIGRGLGRSGPGAGG